MDTQQSSTDSWIVQVPASFTVQVPTTDAATSEDVTAELVEAAADDQLGGSKYVSVELGVDFDYDTFEVIDGPDHGYVAAGHRPRSAVLHAPLTTEEILARRDKDGMVGGVVPVDLDVLIHGDLETILDQLAEKLVGSSLLTDIDITAVGVDDGWTLLMKVRGGVDMLISDL